MVLSQAVVLLIPLGINSKTGNDTDESQNSVILLVWSGLFIANWIFAMFVNPFGVFYAQSDEDWTLVSSSTKLTRATVETKINVGPQICNWVHYGSKSRIHGGLPVPQ